GRVRHQGWLDSRPVRRPGRAAGRRSLGGARAYQAIRALDLDRRAHDGAGRPPGRRRPPLPPPAPTPGGHPYFGASSMKNLLRILPLILFLAVAVLLYRGHAPSVGAGGQAVSRIRTACAGRTRAAADPGRHPGPPGAGERVGYVVPVMPPGTPGAEP